MCGEVDYRSGLCMIVNSTTTTGFFVLFSFSCLSGYPACGSIRDFTQAHNIQHIISHPVRIMGTKKPSTNKPKIFVARERVGRLKMVGF